ncbi:MAG: maleylpyruvate isomerase N-terminal domain-containing protein [Chloroflexi bacterium]|nr:maleylpyruvate isomerase N-terminal domain-containing protein [Chloroflexota bacterium]MBI3732776.1 maleylpyruvate isomerase N-terminal domain-containing protein [Chloroflexota bacterium]
MTDKLELIQRLDTAHHEVLAAVQDFTQAQFNSPGPMGDWTAKDMFGHLAFWNWEAVRGIEQISRGERPENWLLEAFDEINGREAATRRNLSLPAVMDDFRRSQKALAATLLRLPDSELDKTTPEKTKSGKSIIGLSLEQVAW